MKTHLVALGLCSALAAQVPQGWLSPPEPIASLVTAEPPPDVALSPCRRFLLLRWSEAMPGLDVLARPHLKLAGSRIDPLVRGPQLGTKTTKLVLRTLQDGSERALAVPAGHVGGALWSADGERLAFQRATDDGLELWVATTAGGAARKLGGIVLNAVLGAPIAWLPDQKTLLCRLAVPVPVPPPPPAPLGPNVQETLGQKAQVRTNQDMLQSEYDARCFEVLGTSRLARVDADSGAVTPLGEPALFAGVDASPDGAYLLVTRIERPFSYLVPWRSFPRRVDVWTRDGKVLRTVARLPLQDAVPIGGVPTGPRGIDWLPAGGHALWWTEALDGGDPRAVAAHRDAVKVLQDLAGEPATWLQTEHRATGIDFAGEGLAILSEFDRDTRTERVWRLDARELAKAPQKLYERSTQDDYSDPGRAVDELLADGRRLLRQRQSELFRSGQGASSAGDRPFVEAWDPQLDASRRLWQCAEGRYETFAGFLDDARILIRSEAPEEPPNYSAVTLATGARQVLTDFRDPAQEFATKIRKERICYQRADGVALSGTLYLPPGHQDGQRLPVLVWAYPQEFTRAGDAGQVRGSEHRYVRFAGISHLWLLLAGYAVFDDATMPIVGPVRTANDTYVPQLCASAEAAVKVLVDKGVADPARIAIGGHSYGAFMTANLLCHTDLFAAGIARSGAYNRTLTPFGFQNEERTYWEAPDVYQAMSPFAQAHKCNEPILLIHGEDDNNQGTWPIQSQRMFAAIKGHGGVARLVLLPHESHGYRGRESVLQCLAEMVAWLDRYVKNRVAAGGGGSR